MKSLTVSYLSLLRDALRDDMNRAMLTFGLENRQFAQRIVAMDQGQLLRLANLLTVNFLKFNETLALEMLVNGVIDSASEEELRMQVMAHSLTVPSH